MTWQVLSHKQKSETVGKRSSCLYNKYARNLYCTSELWIRKMTWRHFLPSSKISALSKWKLRRQNFAALSLPAKKYFLDPRTAKFKRSIIVSYDVNIIQKIMNVSERNETWLAFLDFRLLLFWADNYIKIALLEHFKFSE